VKSVFRVGFGRFSESITAIGRLRFGVCRVAIGDISRNIQQCSFSVPSCNGEDSHPSLPVGFVVRTRDGRHVEMYSNACPQTRTE
jgi:hypothetical protein